MQDLTVNIIEAISDLESMELEFFKRNDVCVFLNSKIRRISRSREVPRKVLIDAELEQKVWISDKTLKLYFLK